MMTGRWLGEFGFDEFSFLVEIGESVRGKDVYVSLKLRLCCFALADSQVDYTVWWRFVNESCNLESGA